MLRLLEFEFRALTVIPSWDEEDFEDSMVLPSAMCGKGTVSHQYRCQSFLVSIQSRNSKFQQSGNYNKTLTAKGCLPSIFVLQDCLVRLALQCGFRPWHLDIVMMSKAASVSK
mmetsp:Transcript_67158/g.118773  ORF Transcript_67158/g.118773 Transcript_67158/m.118773 type:complete len:113 (-) Transcript_67158:39-377(-)